jgi:hypothetical protein
VPFFRKLTIKSNFVLGNIIPRSDGVFRYD